MYCSLLMQRYEENKRLANLFSESPVFFSECHRLVLFKTTGWWPYCCYPEFFQEKTYILSKKICNFASWFWKELPVKVRLAAINWEREWESPTVPQQWTPLWLLSINAIELRSIAFALDKARMHSALFSLNHAIARLGEKALGSGAKSEDKPFSVTCQTTLDVRAWGETNIFVELWNMNQSSSCTTVVRLLLKR